ncbi:tumor necrosis factor receptor superfamily member 4 [Centropristis striata]|uniref:tumor necrosis factor receptor superfamily member 4 n=1 Tax=Centropristis striata TaxID=184440 RepID=UPI0027DEF214|nr:tumor necrosis factor receptor superfamily member 4 [Centropristis striata]
MDLLKLLLFTLTFYEPIVALAALICPKGHRVSGSTCSSCPDGFYQPEESDSQHCKACSKCNTQRGSYVVQKCTKETDTVCKCHEGFVRSARDPTTCRCDKGSGLTVEGTERDHTPLHSIYVKERKNQKCSECPKGYFSTTINSPCRKWKTCAAGVSKSGSTTSDVVCNELRSNPDITTPSTSNGVVSLLVRITSARPHEAAHSQTLQTTTSTTTAAPLHTAATKAARNPPSSDTGTYIGTGMTLFGIIGLLVLAAVTCKLHIRPTTQLALPNNDSLCRRPVEESGSDSQSSLKLNSGESED